MKLLLTSGGITNQSIKNELINLLTKPIEQSNALCISTSSYALKEGARLAYEFYAGKSITPMAELGWKSVGILELSILPHIDKSIWLNQLKNTDVLLVNGGDPLFLNHWMDQSGLLNEIKNLNIVYVGLSAGSMIMTPRIGNDFVNWQQPSGNDLTQNLVNFSIFPHLNHPMLPGNNLEAATKWSKDIKTLCYAIDEDTAISVKDNKVKIISEGTYKTFNE